MNKIDYLSGLVDALEVVNEMLLGEGLTISTSEFFAQYKDLLENGSDHLTLSVKDVASMKKRAKALEKGQRENLQ